MPLGAAIFRIALTGAALIAQGLMVHAFDCIETKCPQMRSCAEAHHKLTVCGHEKRDADDDGITCEALCGGDMATYKARVKAQMPAAADPAQSADDGTALALRAAARAPQKEVKGGPEGEAQFTCAGKKSCKQMLSCAEAKFYLSRCGVKSLDGNRDGVPCNSLCR